MAEVAGAHERRVIREQLTGDRSVDDGDIAFVTPWRRRMWRSGALLVRLRIREWWERRVRNRRLIRLAFEKWHMARLGQVDPVRARRHAQRVADLRGLLED